jgi:4-amino-4-deoxy-L-arabinose transferase-like glycosyltransferase
MAETGDWVTPRLYGKPWFEKPVLYYWAAAAGFKLFGVSEVTARLPGAISALLATLALAWLALRIYGAQTARWLLLLLPTTVGMVGFSHAAATDMPFAAMLTIAMVFAAHIVGLVPNSPSRSSLSFSSTFVTAILFGFFLGLAVLAKGPAAIILCGGAVFIWALFTMRWRDAFRCLHPAGIVSFCATALPWYILCAHRNPDFFRVFIIEHNFKRFLTPQFQHVQPFWFYVPILLIAFIPWIFVFLWMSIYGFGRCCQDRKISPQAIFFLAWAFFCLLFFSVSRSKLPGYVLPAVPPLGLLLARSHVALSHSARRVFRHQFLALCLLPMLAGVAILWSGKHIYTSRLTTEIAFAMGSALLLFTLSNVLLVIRTTTWLTFDFASFCVVPVLAVVLLFHTFSAPWLRHDPSGKTLAQALQQRQVPPSQIYAANMHRAQQFSLSFYLHSEVQDWTTESPKQGYLLLRQAKCEDYVKLPLQCSDATQLDSSGWVLYSVREANSVGGLAGLGALGSLGDDRRGIGNFADGQPR